METKNLLNIICNGQLPEKLIIRVDAGAIKGLSFGHLARCLVLADCLKRTINTNIVFLMRDYPEGVAHAKAQGAVVKTIPSNLNIDAHDAFWLKHSARFKPDWTFIDLPYDTPYSKIIFQLKKRGSKTLFIDDTRFIHPPADTILNSSILAMENTPLKNSRIKYLLGPEYLIFDHLLSNDLSTLSSLSTPRKGEKIRILISFGGSDPTHLTMKAVKAIKTISCSTKVSVSVVLGPGFKQKHANHASILKQKKSIKIIDAPKNIYPYFLDSDVVICSGGRTLYELIELKIPAFPIASIEHEKPVVEAFIRTQRVKTGLIKWDQKAFLKTFEMISAGLY